MSCSRGKASPNAFTKLRLFADAAGRCQNPECNLPLFRDIGDANIHIGEMAHVFAANNDGPRAKFELTEAERGEYSNLILLCPTCHTTIDKAPAEFPDTVILEWKRRHLSRIDELFGAVAYHSREKAREAVEAALDQNRLVFEKYGPDNDYRFDPESEMATTWRARMLDTILPNNRIIANILKANRALLTFSEKRVLAQFQQHIADLEARHVIEEPAANAERFPEGMDRILTETA